MSVIFTVPGVLHCHICCKPLNVPVYQCENGHISCSSCCTKVQNKCPSCSPEKGFIRCIAIEKVLESIKILCKNSMYGCNKIMGLNQINNHESLCAHKPCSCPLPDCSYVGSAPQLSSHFREKHKVLVKSFSYHSSFTICLNIDDTYRIFQEENDGVLFFLSYSFKTFRNVVTVTMSRIGSSTGRKLCYEIIVKMQGSILSLQSVAKEIQGWSEVPPSNRSLLIPYDGSTSLKLLDFRIWPAL